MDSKAGAIRRRGTGTLTTEDRNFTVCNYVFWFFVLAGYFILSPDRQFFGFRTLRGLNGRFILAVGLFAYGYENSQVYYSLEGLLLGRFYTIGEQPSLAFSDHSDGLRAFQ
jgi:hypothetical protein